MKTFITALALFVFINSSLQAQVPPPPPLQTGEKYTGLYSVSYDYQSNGSVRYILQDRLIKSNLCAILMAQQDSNTASGVGRNIYYSYSDDNGETWTPDRLYDTNFTSGFPDLSLVNGIPVITSNGSNTGIIVAKDLFFGAFAFASIPRVPGGIKWPHLSGTSNGNIVLAGSSYNNFFTGQVTTYNGLSWSLLHSLPLIGGLSGNYSVAAGTNGVVGIFGINYSGDRYLYWYKSTDNGVTFDNGNLIFNYLIDGTDTLYANIVGGFQAEFNGTEPHLVFTVYKTASTVFPNKYTTEYIKPKILHWSPSTGVTQVAGKFNIPNLADTITTSLMAPLGQPSLKIYYGRVYCTFTAFLRGNTQVVNNGDVLNAGEIFANYSWDNGLYWLYPRNITNTPGIEEKQSSLTEKSPYDTLKIFYLRDMKAGNWVNEPAWGKAPVYGIYKKERIITFGINNINSNASSFNLSQNYPNPFNPSTTFKFDIPKSEFTTLLIYDINGKEIVKLVNEKLNAGSYEFEFSSGDYNLSSGVYIYKLVSGEFVDTKKMILLK